MLRQSYANLIVGLLQGLIILRHHLVNVVAVRFRQDLRNLAAIQVQHSPMINRQLVARQLANLTGGRRALHPSHVKSFLLQLVKVLATSRSGLERVSLFLHSCFVGFLGFGLFGWIFLVVGGGLALLVLGNI